MIKGELNFYVTIYLNETASSSPSSRCQVELPAINKLTKTRRDFTLILLPGSDLESDRGWSAADQISSLRCTSSLAVLSCSPH